MKFKQGRAYVQFYLGQWVLGVDYWKDVKFLSFYFGPLTISIDLFMVGKDKRC